MDLESRFNQKIEVVTESGCWIWTATINAGGYGQIGANGKLVSAHRVSWMLRFGEIPNKMFVLHKCDVRSCVNPDHLYLGTHKDNMRDRGLRGRQARPKGESHGRAKLTDSDVLAIRKDTGVNVEISNRYGISPKQVGNIKRGLRWKHLKWE